MKWLGWSLLVFSVWGIWCGAQKLNLHQGIDISTAYQSFENRQTIFIVLSTDHQDIFYPEFFKNMKKIVNEVFYIPGVDRPRLTSIINSHLANNKMEEEGFVAGRIVPEDFDFDHGDYHFIRSNIMRTNYYGILVSRDLKKALISVSALQSVDPSMLVPKIQAVLNEAQKAGDLQSVMVGYAPMRVEFKKTIYQTFWGGLGVLLLFVFFSKDIKNSLVLKKTYSRLFFYTLGIGMILAGGVMATRQSIGFPQGMPIFSSQNTYRQQIHSSLATFDFSMEQVLVLVSPRQGSYTEPKIIDQVNDFQWALANLPGIKNIANLAKAVNYGNVLIHEGFFKWWTIPVEKPTLITVLAGIDPHTGLLTDDGIYMPTRIFLKNYSALDVEQIFRVIQDYAGKSQCELSIQMIGGTALWEGILNRWIKHFIRPFILFMLGLSLICLTTDAKFRKSVSRIMVFWATLFFVFVWIKWLGWGLNAFVFVGWLGGGLCILCLMALPWVSNHKSIWGLGLLGLALNGICSQVAVIQYASGVMVIMLLTWFILNAIFQEEINLEDRDVKLE